ncbi:TVP38/TMEM64 family protein [Sphingomonas sinipercae]|uniref:TVP38/TMEM64 family membrane protein n=1 Tax=Sphingomonas sinipercae TaxID=2714944 RepID=A0A6G7ZKK0_9SPHN|nr:VTT domain-containing protein [Sphingomonas sinipercae]QIL01462.1 TVP38/TMEM64 family protein [Sphingomonas sinipercae]
MTKRLLTIAVLVVALALFFALGLDEYLRLSTIKAAQQELTSHYRRAPGLFIAGFMLLHVTALALCLPGAVLTMALAGGAIFGPYLGTAIVLTSLTIGDSLGFLAARFLIGDWVRKRFANYLEKTQREVDRNGAFYLLSLRLTAAVPYFLVNLAFGVSRMPLRIFAPVSFLGLTPATALYVSTGTELGRIETAGDVLSPRLLVWFTLLAIAPLVARFLLRGVGKRRLSPDS